MAVGAGLAVSACRHKAKDHVIPGCYSSHTFSYLHHNPGAFVAANEWGHPWQVSSAAVIIGMTHPRGSEFYEYFTGLGWVQSDGLNTPGLALFPKNCGLSLHGESPIVRGWVWGE
ncbi:unannotated protein [freshwater metagenome]|uniref:Unannotated protein n=1 Tax=freshwater metagenome TaxID=449393 RepID=A0A6J7A5Q5_9ZZZZ